MKRMAIDQLRKLAVSGDVIGEAICCRDIRPTGLRARKKEDSERRRCDTLAILPWHRTFAAASSPRYVPYQEGWLAAATYLVRYDPPIRNVPYTATS